MRLENNRIYLRLLEVDDYWHLLPFSQNEPELWRFTRRSAAFELLGDYLKDAIEDSKKGTSLPFIIFDKQKRKFVGSTRIYDIDSVAKTAKIGYSWIGQNFQGAGINKSSKFLLLRYAFEVLQLERIEFRVDVRNSKSIAALRSIGCALEGVLRGDCVAIDGTRRQSAILSILKEEWETGIKDRLILQCQDFLPQLSY